ncbi:MAG: serine/threonine-protein kinase, partial [Gammaproteobacteria bacterium]
RPPMASNSADGDGAGAEFDKDRTQLLARPGAPPPAAEGPPLIERRSFDRPPDIAPIKVEGYRVIRTVGAGGMANVFLSERRDDGKLLVLKIMRVDEDEDPRLLRRFLREYQLLSNIDHPNIVRIYDRIMSDDYACLAMEYCDGGDLVQYIGKGLAAETALAYLRQMASGLSVAHARDVVHRDLKPGNILFRKDGTLAVADFGVSARLGESRITHQSEMVGTPYYLSPEQIQGGEVDHRGDVYALGIILYEMLTGHRPYVSRHLSKLIDLHLNAPTPTLPEEHAQLQPLLDGLLAKRVEDRFQSAEEVLLALDMLT